MKFICQYFPVHFRVILFINIEALVYLKDYLHKFTYPQKLNLKVLVISSYMLSHMGVLSRIMITSTCGNWRTYTNKFKNFLDIRNIQEIWFAMLKNWTSCSFKLFQEVHGGNSPCIKPWNQKLDYIGHINQRESKIISIQWDILFASYLDILQAVLWEP